MFSVAKFDMQRALVVGLQAMGIYDQIVGSPVGPKRIDANETAVMARELEFIFAEVYRKEFPDLVGRSLVPVKPGPGPGHESHTITEIDRFGSAKIINNYADDFPSTEVQGHQTSQLIRSIGNSYQYTVQELRAAALTRIQMTSEKAEQARESMEQELDSLIASGDATTGLKGLNDVAANFNAVAKVSPAGTWATLWAAAADELSQRNVQAQILADVRALFVSVPTATLNKHMADTLALDTASYNFLAFTERGGAISSPQTLLEYIKANVPGLKSVVPWSKLNTAGTGGHSRMYALTRDPKVLYQVIPQEFEQFPPQQRNLAFKILCHMRWGGVVSPYPKAHAYMDLTGS